MTKVAAQLTAKSNTAENVSLPGIAMLDSSQDVIWSFLWTGQSSCSVTIDDLLIRSDYFLSYFAPELQDSREYVNAALQ